MKLFLACILIVTPFLLSGCTEPVSELSPEQDADDANVAYIETFSAQNQRKLSAELIDATTENIIEPHLDFSFSEFRNHSPPLENTITAPFDLQQLLAQLSLGAEGATLDAFISAGQLTLNGVVSYDDISLWEQEINGLDSISRQSVIWGQLGYRFSADFLQDQAELFGPEMVGLDFITTSEQSLQSILDRLELDSALLAISSRTRLFSAHQSELAVTWSGNVITESVVARFGAHELQQRVNMVRIEGLMNIAETADYRAVEVPFSDTGLALLMITPAAGRFESVRLTLDRVIWQDMLATLTPINTSIYVPEFVLERDLQSHDIPDLGVALTDAGPVISTTDFSQPIDMSGEPVINIEASSFSEPVDPSLAADFSAVNNAGFLFLETPAQRVALNLNAQGINASTITAAAHTASNDEPHYLFTDNFFGAVLSNGSFSISSYSSIRPCFNPPDQSPFIFAIYARDSGTLLYLGQLMALDGEQVEPDWTVDSNTSCGDVALVDVYRYKGSLQCEINSGTALSEMAQTLADAGIAVLGSYESTDEMMRIQMCGVSDGVINVFSIQQSQLLEAQSLGFDVLSNLL